MFWSEKVFLGNDEINTDDSNSKKLKNHDRRRILQILSRLV